MTTRTRLAAPLPPATLGLAAQASAVPATIPPSKATQPTSA